MKRYTDEVLSQVTGLPLLNAAVTVRNSSTSALATLYTTDDVNSAPAANPFVAGGGSFSFFVPDGRYDIIVQAGSRVRTISDVDLFDGAEQNRRLEAVENGEPGAPGSLRADLLAGSGAARVKTQLAYAGAIVRDVHAALGDTVSVTAFGGIGNGSANDTAALRAAVGTGRSVFLPDGHYNFDPTLGPLALSYGQTIYGRNAVTTTINAIANGDVIAMAAASALHDVGLQGNGASVNARGVIFGAGTSNCSLRNVNILDFQNYCLEVLANNGASQLQVIGGLVGRTDANQCAFKLPAGDTQATPRQFVGVNALGFLIDVAGADNTLITGCYMRNLLLSALSRKVLISGCRISTIGADFVVQGLDNAVTGCAVAGRIVLAPGTQTSRASGNVTVGAVVDDSGNSSNVIDFTLKASKVWDPISLANAGGDSTTLPVPGVTLAGGWFVRASLDKDLQGMTLTAYVSADDVVTVKLYNSSGGPVDITSGIVRVLAMRF